MSARKRGRQSKPFPVGIILAFAGVLGTFIAIGIIATIVHKNNVAEENAKTAAKNAEIKKKNEEFAKKIASGEGPALPPREKAWQTVQVFTGVGLEETDQFNIASKEWKIIWKIKESSSPDAPKFSINLNSAEGDALGEVVKSDKAGSGEYIHKGKAGKFYLIIDADGYRWEVEVKDYR